MIKNQYPYIDNDGVEHTNLVRNYSDRGMRIKQVETGDEYDDAVDVIPCRYTYEETETPIETTEEE